MSTHYLSSTIVASNCTYNGSDIEIVANAAQLKLQNNAGTYTQNFATSSGFTFDATKTAISGTLSQVDQRVAGTQSAATYTSGLNLNYGGGTLTATNNGATHNAGAGTLEVKGSAATRYVDYVGTGNADATQTGAIRLKVIPNYTGTPTTTQYFCRATQADNNANNSIGLSHSTLGNIQAQIFDSAGVAIVNGSFGSAWAPSAGTQYEIELNWDITTGANRIFIDGVQKGTTNTATGTRTNNVALLRVGERHIVATNYADFSLAAMRWFNTVQHTSNYTPTGEPAETIYGSDLITLPAFSDTNVTAYNSFSVTATATCKFSVNSKYWNGSAWVASDGSSGQMNSAATINTNIPTLSASASTTVKILTTDSNSQESADDLSIGYTYQRYSTQSPTVTTTAISADDINSLTVTSAGSTVKGVAQYGGVDYYYSGGWQVSNGTVAQSSTIAVLTANIGSLLSEGHDDIKFKFFLTSSDGLSTPSFTSVLVSYDFWAEAAPEDPVIVYGWVYSDWETPLSGATVELVRTDDQVLAGILYPWGESISLTTDNEGYFEVALIRGTYRLTAGGRNYEDIVIPDQDTYNIMGGI